LPEMNEMKKLRGWRLSDAADHGQLLTVECQLCRVTRRYFPRDLLKFRQDENLARTMSCFRCDGCGKRDYMFLRVLDPSIEDHGKLTVRRLVRVKTVCVPVWRDDVL